MQQIVAFGPVYLDFIVRQLGGPLQLLYGTERILRSYVAIIGSNQLFLSDRYNEKQLQVLLDGSSENGTGSISLNGEQIPVTYETVLGGSTANFARQMAKLGLNPLLVAVHGNNPYGRRVRDLVQSSLSCAMAEVEAPQTVSINVHESQEAAMLTSGDSNRQLTLERLAEAFKGVLGQGTFLYAGGFFKQEHLFPHYPELFHEAQQLGARVILDHGRFLDKPGTAKFSEEAGAAQMALRYVDIYLPNMQELEGLTGIANLENRSNLEKALQAARVLGPGLVVCKTGAAGASIINGAGINHVPQELAGGKIESLVGAGDFFNAFLIEAIRRGLGHVDAVRFANAGAYLKITGGDPSFEEAAAMLRR